MACCRRTRTYLCRWMYYLFLVLGLVLACCAVATCRFVDVEDPNAVGHQFESVGLFRHYNAEAGHCIVHHNNKYTKSENGARMGGVVAPLLAAAALLLIAMESCCFKCLKGCLRWVVRFFLLLAVVMEGLTFLWLGSEVCGGDWYQEVTTQKPCTLDQGAVWAAMATAFFFVCLVVVNWIPSPYEKKDKTAAGDDEDKDGIMVDKPNKKKNSKKGSQKNLAATGSTAELDDKDDGDII